MTGPVVLNPENGRRSYVSGPMFEMLATPARAASPDASTLSVSVPVAARSGTMTTRPAIGTRVPLNTFAVKFAVVFPMVNVSFPSAPLTA